MRKDSICAWRRQIYGDLPSALRFDEDKAAQSTFSDTSGRLESAIYEALHLPKPMFPPHESNRSHTGKRQSQTRADRESGLNF